MSTAAARSSSLQSSRRRLSRRFVRGLRSSGRSSTGRRPTTTTRTTRPGRRHASDSGSHRHRWSSRSGGRLFVFPQTMTKRTLRRPARYVVVGAWNTAFGLALFTILYLALGSSLGYIAVLTVAQVIAVVQSHATQRLFVWKSAGPYWPELLRFSLVYARVRGQPRSPGCSRRRYRVPRCCRPSG